MSTTFNIGPSADRDIRERRPYFLLPLLELTNPQDLKARLDALQETVKKFVLHEHRAEPAKTQVTDVYVLSHGWHRDFFAAIAAYDRLVSRFVTLYRRKVLKAAEGDAYLPIFVAVHWHSDPGEDDWIDDAGRRLLAAFLQNARAAFVLNRSEPTATEANFETDFENLYQLFTNMAAPGSKAISDRKLIADAEKHLEYLHSRYEVRGGPDATSTEKAAVAWTCYHDAQPSRVLLSQGERARPFGSPGAALRALFKFALTGGLVAAGLQQISGQTKTWIQTAAAAFWAWYRELPFVDMLADGFVNAPGWPSLGMWKNAFSSFEHVSTVITTALRFVAEHAVFGWLLLLPLATVGMLLLYGMAAWEDHKRRERVKQHKSEEAVGTGLSFLALLCWLPAQLFVTLPLLAYLFLTFLLGGLYFRYVMFLHPERATGDPPRNPSSLREMAAKPSRWPVSVLRRAVPRDSLPAKLANGLNNQLAFFEMQRKAVAAGEHCGEVVDEITTRIRALAGDDELSAIRNANLASGEVWNPRIHLIGHSFGCSVMLNAARTLARRHRNTAEADRPRLHSLSLLMPALASGWLKGEKELNGMVKGAIACCYSAYDLANGFYYPAGNNSRLSAGYVGLSEDANGKTPFFLGLKGEYATLTTPPQLDVNLQRLEAWRIKNWPDYQPLAGAPTINVDCSRFVYEGSPLLGGGHGDIFKNDVVHLIWAVTTLPSKPSSQSTEIPEK